MDNAQNTLKMASNGRTWEGKRHRVRIKWTNQLTGPIARPAVFKRQERGGENTREWGVVGRREPLKALEEVVGNRKPGTRKPTAEGKKKLLIMRRDDQICTSQRFHHTNRRIKPKQNHS